MEAVEDDRFRWADAVHTASIDLDEALREYRHAQQQLELANRRAGKAIWRIKQHGFGSITRPRKELRPHSILHDGRKFYFFLSVTLLI